MVDDPIGLQEKHEEIIPDINVNINNSLFIR